MVFSIRMSGGGAITHFNDWRLLDTLLHSPLPICIAPVCIPNCRGSNFENLTDWKNPSGWWRVLTDFPNPSGLKGEVRQYNLWNLGYTHRTLN